MRREAVAVHVDDVNVAWTQRDALFEQMLAAIDQRVQQPVADLVVAELARGDSGLARLFCEELLDLGIGNRLAPFADRLCRT